MQYDPYDDLYPPKQVTLLCLWDDIGLPHSKRKKVFGRTLTIIGLNVDPQAMTITMLEVSKLDLINSIRSFIDSRASRRRPLVEWQRLLGWINWALNAYPLLKPALRSSYDKITGKTHPKAPMFLNRSVIQDLSWLASTMETSDGVCMLDTIAWDPKDADLQIFCDATLSSLGFYCPMLAAAFVSSPESLPLHTILFQETLCVVSAIAWAATLKPLPCRLVVKTDSLDTVEMFHSLKAMTDYNDLLFSAIHLLITHSMTLRVFHIMGTENTVSDALSGSLFGITLAHHPGLHIHLFQPPQDVLGASIQ